MKNNKKEKDSGLISASSVGLVQKTGVPGIIFGMLCRFAVAYVGVCGVCLMLDDAFGFFNGASDPGRVFFLSFVFCAAFFLFFTAANTNGVAFGLAALALVVALVVIDMQNGFRHAVVNIPLSAWNHILTRLDSLGYTSLNGLLSTIPETNPRTADGMLYTLKAFRSFIALVSFVFVSCTYKRVRVVPIIITAGIVMTVTFTYNILTNNIGFMLTVSSGLGIVVMKYSDVFAKSERLADKKAKLRFFAKRRLQVTHASTRGFASFIAMAIVFSIAIYPAIMINRPFPELTVFSNFMEDARDFLGSYLTVQGGAGDDSDAAHKSTQPTPRQYKNRRVMTVSASSSSPLYLRAWAGEEYRNNQWYSARDNSASILPEQITELFYTIVDVDCNVLSTQYLADTATMKRGFVKEFVTVKSTSLRGYRGYLPSRFSTIYGLTDPSDMNAKYVAGYTLMNGTGMADVSMKDAYYGAVSYAPNYKSVSLSRLDKDMTVYRLVRPYIYQYIVQRLYSGIGTDEVEEWLREAKKQILDDAAAAGVDIPAGCLINRIADMSNNDLEKLYNLMNEADQYEARVYSTCLSVPWSEQSAISDAASQAFSGLRINGVDVFDIDISSSSIFDPESSYYLYGLRFSDVYTCADKAARYLAKTCEYELEPHGYDQNGYYASQFLTTARNGYCVQYATAGALMLRCVGIPTRYVDGYLASDLSYSGGAYTGTVYDRNAHAWVEVYISGYGWMTFEMTGPMMEGIYASSTPSVIPDDTTSPVTTDIYTDTETTRGTDTVTTDIPGSNTDTTDIISETTGPVTPGDNTAKRVIITVAVIFAVLLLISTAVYLYLRKTTVRHRKFMRRLEKAAAGGSSEPGRDIDRAGKYILFLLSLSKLIRGNNELMTEFVSRVDALTGGDPGFSGAAGAMQKNSFGHCADENDAKDAAEYALYLRAFTLRRLSGFNKFYFVKLRKLI